MTYERDWNKIDDLLIAGCEGTEIASALGITAQTLYAWCKEEKNQTFHDYAQHKRAKGDGLLKAQQFAKAMGLTEKGDNTMLIWLGKTRLKQKEESLINCQAHYTIKASDGLTIGANLSPETISNSSDKSSE